MSDFIHLETVQNKLEELKPKLVFLERLAVNEAIDALEVLKEYLEKQQEDLLSQLEEWAR